MVRRGVRFSVAGRLSAGLAAAAFLCLAATAVVGVRPASACTCAAGSVGQFREWVDTGFVGTLVERGPALDKPIDRATHATVPHVFAVERWIFGRTAVETDGDGAEVAEVTIHSPPGGGCGFELRIQERVAVFARGEDGLLVGGLCSTMPADVALAQIEPTVARSGLARFAVIGNFDGALAAYFDGDGRFLGYDGETLRDVPWQPWAVACDDGHHAAVLDDLTVRVVAVATAEDVVEPITIDEDIGPHVARCIEPGALDIVEQPAGGGLRARDPAAGRTRTILDRPSGQYAATNHGFAIVEYLDPGERLLIVDPDGTEREIGRLDRGTEDTYRGYASVETSPDGDDLGLLEVAYRGGFDDVTSTIRIVDAATGHQRLSRVIEGESWGAHWVDAEHLGLVFGSDDVSHIEILDGTTLETIGTIPRWLPNRSVLVDRTLWGLYDGTLYRTNLDGEPEPVFTLPVRTSAPLLVLAEPVERTGSPAATGQPAARSEGPASDFGGTGAALDPVDVTAPPTQTAAQPPSAEATDGASADGGSDLWWLAAAGASLALGMGAIPLLRHRRGETAAV